MSIPPESDAPSRARLRVTQARRDPLRIGCVKYLNARPLIHGWPGAVEFDHPANLCRKLRAAELDVAFVSSFEFLRDPVYNIVNGVAVGADGPVYSVVLAHRRGIENIEEVAVDPASRTSTNLLRCLLAEDGLAPQFMTPASDDQAIVTDTRARLLIGDQAISFREEHSTDLQFRDLGSWWKGMTGLPFVFAIWLIRPEVADATQIAARLRELRDRNLRHLDEVIAAQGAFNPPFSERYFRENLCFGFADREQQGLLKFRSLCAKHAILQGNAPVLRLV